MVSLLNIADRRVYITFMAGLLLGEIPPVGYAFQEDQTSVALSSADEKQRLGQYALARNILLKQLFETPESPSLLNALGSVQQDLGDYHAAENFYRRALDASAKSNANGERIIAMNNLGTLYLDTGQYKKGEWVREELEKLPPSTLAKQPVAAAMLLNVLGSLEHVSKRDYEAERYYRLSLELLSRDQRHAAEIALVRNNLGFLQLEAGQYDAARDLFQQVIQQLEVAAGPDDRNLLRPLLNLAMCENITGHPEQAESLARRAVKLSDRSPTEPTEAATALLELSKAVRRLGRKSEARDLERRAKTLLVTSSTAMLGRHTVSIGALRTAR